MDSVAEFESATLSGVDVVEGIHFDSLELVIAVQPNAATSAQQGVLDSIVDYGVTREVVVQIVEIS